MKPSSFVIENWQIIESLKLPSKLVLNFSWKLYKTICRNYEFWYIDWNWFKLIQTVDSLIWIWKCVSLDLIRSESNKCNNCASTIAKQQLCNNTFRNAHTLLDVLYFFCFDRNLFLCFSHEYFCCFLKLFLKTDWNVFWWFFNGKERRQCRAD